MPSRALSPSLLETCLSRLNDIVLITEAEPIDEPGPRVLYVNDAFVRRTGYSREEIIGRSPRILQGPKTSRAELDRVRRALKEWKPIRSELINYTKTGEEFWLEMDLVPVADETGWYTHWIAIERDITRRKAAEEALKASEQRYRLLFDNSPLPMWVYDRQTLRFLAVNQAAIHKYGYTREEFLLLNIDEIRPPSDIPRLREVVSRPASGLQSAGIWKHRTKSGKLLTVEVYSDDAVFEDRDARLVMPVDMTERMALEEQLQQAQKMETVGQLAGGIAHDFNNLLTVINGYSQILLEQFAGEPAVQGIVQSILRSGERAAKLTSQLLAYSRRQVLMPKIVQIDSLLESMRPILERLIREDIEIEWRLEPNSGLVTIDPSQFEQVVMNLAINARDAMRDGGVLTIEVANRYLDETYCRLHPDVAPGSYVMFRIGDNGHGMPPEVVKRIFDPFFTTKAPGVGTGLGLSTVYGIVKQSSGHIDVESEPGAGSRFSVYLPMVEGEPTPSELQSVAASDELRGDETVLVVEDDGGVREFAVGILRRMGYQVLEAASGPDAIVEAEKHPGAIQLLLTDVVIPKINGPDLAEFLTQRRPELKVIFMSGYSDYSPATAGFGEDGAHHLIKPFSTGDLLRKVRFVLSMPQRVKVVVIADDEEPIRELFRTALESAGYKCYCSANGIEVMKQLRELDAVDLLITDLVMPGREGLETISLVEKEFPNLKILAISGYADSYLEMASMLGANSTLAKPFYLETLCERVKALIG